jgi:hypothetical protein
MKKNIVSAIVAIGAIVYIGYLVARQRTVPQAVSNGIEASFSCDNGKSIDATFFQGETKAPIKEGEPPIPAGSVKVVLSDGRTMTLGQSISADGARYANPDESFVFWNKGNGVMVLENGKALNYLGCIVVVPQPAGSNLSRVYSNGTDGFSLRVPATYVADEGYQYELGPKRVFSGVKFTIAPTTADRTNLGHDTYLSVESLPKIETCNANLFLDQGEQVKPATEITENGTTYSVGATMGAGAGNRYEQTVYAIPGSSPCRAVRYFVHYSVFENYPAGMVREFDKAALLREFDLIRSTLVLN